MVAGSPILSNQFLKSALECARLGWRVFPLSPNSKKPAIKKWPELATTDEAAIADWWRRFPNANVGIATGEVSGLVVVDIDPSKGGADNLEELEEELGQLPETVMVITGNLGTHFYFKHPGGRVANSADRIASGIDIRGDGGLVAAPPSIHSNGRRYEWEGAHEPADTPLADMPQWLVDRAAGREVGPFRPPVEWRSGPVPFGPLHDGCKWLQRCRTEAATLPEPEWYQMLTVVARCDNPESVANYLSKPHPKYTQQETQRKLQHAANAPGPVTCECVAKDLGQAELCMQCEWRGKVKTPIQIKAAQPAAAAPEQVPPPDPEDDGSKVMANDLARLILHDHTFLANKDGGTYEYNGRFWDRITPSTLESYALQVDTHRHTTKRRRSEIASYIKANCYMDPIPWRQLGEDELPLFNGVLNLRTRNLRPHRPEDYLESIVEHSYHPEAQCPVWMRCLGEWFEGDEESPGKIKALQEFFGYTLLPQANLKKCLYLYGDTDCGKSQVLAAMVAMVGAHNCTSISPSKMDNPRDLAPIRGKMLNQMSELGRNTLIADGGFKKLISTGDPVQLDQKFLEAEMYVPFAKHIFVMNTLPEVSDLTRATFNRILVIQFNNSVPEEKQDRQLEKKFKAEIVGILNWAIEGAARLIQNGGVFTYVAESIQLVERYRLEQNPVYGFVESNLIENPGQVIRVEDFDRRFNAWNTGPKKFSQGFLKKLRESAGLRDERRVVDGRPIYEIKDYSWVGSPSIQ